MKTVRVKLDTIEDIRSFNASVNAFPDCEFDMEEGKYYIDAKSILGLLSLNFSTPLQLHFTATPAEEEQILSMIGKYIVD